MGRTITSECEQFEWDTEKDFKNKKNHGIAFSEVLEIFNDPFCLTRYDTMHSVEEDRDFSLGSLNGVVVIAVSHTDRNGKTRIISARQAEPKLQEVYFEHVKKANT